MFFIATYERLFLGILRLNAMIVNTDCNWVLKTLRACEMSLVWNKQTKRLLIDLTCEKIDSVS